MKKPDLSGAYTENKDKKKDAYLTKDLTPKEKAEFKEKDDAHGKKNPPKTMRGDAKTDIGIIKTINPKKGDRLEKALSKDAGKKAPKGAKPAPPKKKKKK